MILDTEELIEAMADIIQEKEGHKEDIRNIESNIEAICTLESLQGEGGSAIKEHFMTLHLPVLLLTQQFIEAYKGHLEQVRGNLLAFDSENALVRLPYLEDVKGDLNQVINYTQESADTINASYNRVSDLVSTGPLEISSLIDGARGAKDNIDETEEALLESDEANHSILNEAKELLSHFGDLVSKVEGWVGGEVELSPETLKEISDYFQDSQAVSYLMDNDVMMSIFDKLVDGDNITYAEQELISYFIQNEIVDEKELETIVELIGEDSDGLKDRLNHGILTSEGTLDDEIAMIEGFLYSRDMKPEVYDMDPADVAKLNAYLGVLNNYNTAISEVKEEMDPIEIAGEGNPLFARVEYLHYKEADDPYTLTINSEIAISLTQYEDDPDREKFLNMRQVLPGRLNESEVTVFRGELAPAQLQNSQNENLEEESAKYRANFIGEELLQQLIGLNYISAGADIAARYNAGQNELERDMKVGDVKSSAIALNAEVQVSDRFVPGASSNQLDVSIIPTEETFAILDRWKEVANINPQITYPAEEIQNQDWDEVSNILTGNQAEMERINSELPGYIINDRLDDDKTVEEVARED